MSTSSLPDADGVITYALTSRLSTEGRVAISLQLFKGREVAHTRSLGLVDRRESADVMYKCHMHLNRLGVQRLSAPEAAPSRLPPAQMLRVKQ